MADRMDTDDDDDPVEQELDIYLSKELAHSTYLLQFPLQGLGGAGAAAMLQKTTEVRMKPHRNLMELDLALDTNCSNYDPENQLASATRTLKSTPVPARANYAVGAVRAGADGRNELHLTPLHSTLQMRPSFQTVDERDEKLREESGEKKPADFPAAKKKPAEDGAAPQLYQVTIKRAETERTIERRQNSHAYLERQQAKEPWLPVNLNQMGSRTGKSQFEKLFASEDASTCEALPPMLSQEGYLHLLSPPLASAGMDAPLPTASAQLSMVALRRLPLKERVVQLLSHCVVLRFDRLTALSGATPEQEEDLIKATTANATLVQGCWVSSRIDLVAFRVSSTQVEDEEQLKLQHDHLLLSLVQEPFVDRVQFLADTLMGGANADKLFGALCVKLPGKGFKIKLEADGAFCQKYPEVVAEQKEAWLTKADDVQQRLERHRISAGPQRDSSAGRPNAWKEDSAPMSEGGGGAEVIADQLTLETIADMKVTELRRALEDRGLSSSGLKSALVERLEATLL